MNKKIASCAIVCMLLCANIVPLQAKIDRAEIAVNTAIGVVLGGTAALAYHLYNYGGLHGIYNAATAGVGLLAGAYYLIHRGGPRAEDGLADAFLIGGLLGTTGIAGTVWTLCSLGRWLWSSNKVLV